MQIRIRYDNSFQTVEVTEAECESMIRNDYEERRAAATDPSTVQPRTMQEIMDERFNRPEHSNYKKEHRRCYSLDGCDFEGTDFLDPSADHAADYEKEEMLLALKEAMETLQPQQKELIKRIFSDGETVIGIAEKDGVLRSSVYHRLDKIYAVLQKKLKNFE